MKGISKSRMLIVLGIALVMVLFSLLIVDSRIQEASDELAVQQAQLQTEYDRLKKIDDARADYTSQTEKFNTAYAGIIEDFPAAITQNNQIMFLRDIEDEFNVRIQTASYTDPEVVYQFQSIMPGNKEGYTLVRSTLQFPMQLSYEEWKRFIAYLEESGGRQVLETVSTDYDRSSGLVNADVTISEYAIAGDDRLPSETETEVEIGTTNIFHSDSPLSAEAGYQTYNASGAGSYSGGAKPNENESGIRSNFR